MLPKLCSDKSSFRGYGAASQNCWLPVAAEQHLLASIHFKKCSPSVGIRKSKEQRFYNLILEILVSCKMSKTPVSWLSTARPGNRAFNCILCCGIDQSKMVRVLVWELLGSDVQEAKGHLKVQEEQSVRQGQNPYLDMTLSQNNKLAETNSQTWKFCLCCVVLLVFVQQNTNFSIKYFQS